MMFEKYIFLFKSFLRPNCKYSFIRNLKKSSKILDIGSGNINTAKASKYLVKNSIYYGIDIYRNISKSLSNQYIDNYIITDKNKFNKEIRKIEIEFDAVICSHVIEHVDDREETLKSLITKLKKGGYLYLSFPSEYSVNFPSRSGTLNYYDDPTHIDKPPEFKKMIEILKQNQIKIEFKSKRYRPLFLFLIGFIADLVCVISKKGSIGVWEKWGFESIIIGEKII